MSWECGECEFNVYQGHAESCSRFKPYPDDVCECGGERREHVDGPDGTAHLPARKCPRFRFLRPAYDEEV
jgi:hypothetical protein